MEKPKKPYQHKDDPESFWERMRLIHGSDVQPPEITQRLSPLKITEQPDENTFARFRQPLSKKN